MNISKSEILKRFAVWLKAWNEHNLDGVMQLCHEDIIFENWTGECISGKKSLRRLWAPWFLNHGNFRFIEEDIFFDTQEQKMVFQWQLEWPSLEKHFKGKPEKRRGVDIIHFEEGKIKKKYTYSKTTIYINSSAVSLSAHESKNPDRPL